MKAVALLVIGAIAGGVVLWDRLTRKARVAPADDSTASQWDFGTPGILSEDEAEEALAAYVHEIRKMSGKKYSERLYSAYWDAANIHLWSKNLHGDDVIFSDKRLDAFLRKLGHSDGKHYFVSDRNEGCKRHQNLKKHGWDIHYYKRKDTFAGKLADSRGLFGWIGSLLTGPLGAKPYTANVDGELIAVMESKATRSDVVVLLSGDHGFVDSLNQLRPETIKVVISGREALSRSLKATSDQYLNANLFLTRARA